MRSVIAAVFSPLFLFWILSLSCNDPVTSQAPEQDVKYLQFDGLSFLKVNLSRLHGTHDDFFKQAETEVFEIYFSTTKRSGLIWLHEYQGRKMYLAMRDGYLMFVNHDGNAQPDIFYFGRRERESFNTGKFYKFRIDREGEKIELSVDDRYKQTFIFSRRVQFLVPAMLYIGGTRNTPESTENLVTDNFLGTLARMRIWTFTQEPSGLYRNELRIIEELSEDPTTGQNGIDIIIGVWNPLGPPTPPPTVKPPTAPPARLTAVTLKDPNVYVEVRERLQLSGDNTLAFKFTTINQQGLLLFTTSNIYGKNFIALEIYDGKLYMVHNFGMSTKRTIFSERIVSDGQQHEVVLQFFNDRVIIKLDGQTTQIPLVAGELLPQNLGNIYLGRFNTYTFLPWHMWSNQSYQGCIDDVQINGQVIDFYNFFEKKPEFENAVPGCQPMPQACSRSRICGDGACYDSWRGFRCDCSATDYMGTRCDVPAWTGLFNGTHRHRITLTPQQRYNINNISFRFKTMAADGLIFQTRARTDGAFLRAELEDGRMKITSNIGGEYKTFRLGQFLNDMNWHTVNIQRRGNQIVVWIDDDQRQMAFIPGENFYLYVDDIFIGGYNREDNLNIPANTRFYVGYLRNFRFNGYDLFGQLQRQGLGPFYQYPNIPPLLFNEITLTSYNSFIRLDGLKSLNSLNLYFQFKTKEPSGVIFFNEGANKEMFAIDLFDGQIYVMFSVPGKQPVRIETPSNRRFDDGQWHSMSIVNKLVEGNRQLRVVADNITQSYTYSGISDVPLQGELFVGGIPSTYYEKDYVSDLLYSTQGYRGCLASVDFGRSPVDLREAARVQGITIYDTCQAIISRCTEDSCDNGGICYDNPNNGTISCDCSLTGWGGKRCDKHPLGYYFRSEGIPDKYGMLVYTYPRVKQVDSDRDEIVFGVMTREENAVLLKMISALTDDFIEIRLVDGYVEAAYKTDEVGVVSTVNNGDVSVSDGRYHIVRFVRTANNATLYVDDKQVINRHLRPHGKFDRLSKIFVGGVYQSGQIQDGTGYWGIIGGLNVNRHLFFYDSVGNINTEFFTDVVEAPIPYTLGTMQKTTEKPWEPVTDYVTPPPVVGIPILPSDIGGAGIAWTVGAGGGDAVDVVVFPGGSGGSAGTIPGALPPSGPEAAQLAVASVGSLPVVGPRAGAVMGTLLGLALFATSLMWAFYRCKPGWCGGAGAGAGGPVISAPASTSNIGAVNAAAANNAAGADVDMDSPDTALLAGVPQAKIVASNGSTYTGAQVINGQSTYSHRADSYDSATLRAMGTFSNRGTALGTSNASHHQFSSASGYSESNMMVTTPASMQSYQIENSNPDYDVATGVHANAGGFSSSTMSSNYNYSVKTIKTMGGTMGSMSNVIVTPGAMGEEIRVDCCLMTADGHSVVTGSSLGPPQVWNMSNGELLRIMQGETVGSTYLHLLNGDRLLVGAINSDLEINQYSVPKGVHNYVFQVWDFATGRPLDMAERETLSAMAVMNDRDKVVFGRSDKFGGGTNIIIWDILGNQAIKEMRYDAPVGNNDYISYINVSQNDRYIVAGFTNTFDNFAEFVLLDTTMTSYNISDPNILRLDASPECTAILPRDEAVTGLRNGDLVVWSIKTGQPSRQLLSNNGKHAHSREVKAVARSEDNKFLVSASADGTLKLWDLETERHICTMNGHNDEVWCCAISEDNEIVVSGSRDGTIRLWKLRNGQEICAFNAGVDVFYITMSRDKGTIVALGDKYGARKLIMLQVVRSKVKRTVPA